jgi:hypothetical protein
MAVRAQQLEVLQPVVATVAVDVVPNAISAWENP